jgi:hypothetical protein
LGKLIKNKEESHIATLSIIRVHLLASLLPLGVRGVTPFLLRFDEELAGVPLLQGKLGIVGETV